jgi:hypothetical protein
MDIVVGPSRIGENGVGVFAAIGNSLISSRCLCGFDGTAGRKANACGSRVGTTKQTTGPDLWVRQHLRGRVDGRDRRLDAVEFVEPLRARVFERNSASSASRSTSLTIGSSLSWASRRSSRSTASQKARQNFASSAASVTYRPSAVS